MYIFFFFFLLVSGGASRWRVCYQWGLPHLVSQCLTKFPQVHCLAKQLETGGNMSCFEGKLCGITQEYNSDVWQLKLELNKSRLIRDLTEGKADLPF